MTKEKQHIFSARTTKERLRQLNELKQKLGVEWDDLVIDAVCGKYGLEKVIMALPKKAKPAKENSELEKIVEEQSATDQNTGEKANQDGKKVGDPWMQDCAINVLLPIAPSKKDIGKSARYR
jgi:hypothetical protein